MTSTDELRRLLDERGEHYVSDGSTVTWSYYTDPHTATESMDGTLIVTGLMPEQAIAATLGNGTCEYVIEDNMNESEGMGDVWFRCTNCDTTYDYYADDWLMKQNYCPHCGFKIRKAVER